MEEGGTFNNIFCDLLENFLVHFVLLIVINLNEILGRILHNQYLILEKYSLFHLQKIWTFLPTSINHHLNYKSLTIAKKSTQSDWTNLCSLYKFCIKLLEQSPTDMENIFIHIYIFFYFFVMEIFVGAQGNGQV